MTAHPVRRFAVAPLALAALLAAACGSSLDQGGDAPVLVVVNALEASSGAEPNEFGGILFSDVITVVDGVPTVFADNGRVSLTLVPRDPGPNGSPSDLNSVTFTSYRVVYRRADGPSAPGVDVPAPFDAAVTFTVPAQGSVTYVFELVRHAAKENAPIAPLASNGQIISAIADVTFFGRDQAGNNVSVTGGIAINFGNFSDPD